MRSAVGLKVVHIGGVTMDILEIKERNGFKTRGPGRIKYTWQGLVYV